MANIINLPLKRRENNFNGETKSRAVDPRKIIAPRKKTVFRLPSHRTWKRRSAGCDKLVFPLFGGRFWWKLVIHNFFFSYSRFVGAIECNWNFKAESWNYALKVFFRANPRKGFSRIPRICLGDASLKADASLKTVE